MVQDIQDNLLTPVLVTEQNSDSSLNGESYLSVDKVLISTKSKIEKEGSRLSIDGVTTDISKMSLLDFCIYLKSRGIEVSFIDNNNYWQYPALCIKDFSNQEQKEISLPSSPYPLLQLKTMPNLCITPYDEMRLNVLSVVDSSLNKKEYICSSGLLITKKYEDTCKLIYSVKSDMFAIKLDYKFSTTSKETLSRYIDNAN